MTRLRHKIVAWGLAVLVVNSVYLVALVQASVFYEANVLLHFALGAGLAVLAVRLARRHPTECGVFLAAALPTIWLAIEGNTRDHRWALWLHIVLGWGMVPGLRVSHSES